MENKTKNTASGVGILEVIQMILIVLKLFKLIDISWVQVFIPSFISIGILTIALVVLLIYYLLND